MGRQSKKLIRVKFKNTNTESYKQLIEGAQIFSYNVLIGLEDNEKYRANIVATVKPSDRTAKIILIDKKQGEAVLDYTHIVDNKLIKMIQDPNYRLTISALHKPNEAGDYNFVGIIGWALLSINDEFDRNKDLKVCDILKEVE